MIQLIEATFLIPTLTPSSGTYQNLLQRCRKAKCPHYQGFFSFFLIEGAFVHKIKEHKGITLHWIIIRHCVDTCRKLKRFFKATLEPSICLERCPVTVGLFDLSVLWLNLAAQAKLMNSVPTPYPVPCHSPDPRPIGRCQRRTMRRGWRDGGVALGNVEAQVGILK